MLSMCVCYVEGGMCAEFAELARLTVSYTVFGTHIHKTLSRRTRRRWGPHHHSVIRYWVGVRYKCLSSMLQSCVFNCLY